MPALVTLEHAKQHLGITTIDRDTDLQIKCEQASAIILDYLKHRANIEATITTSTVDVASVITTTAAHGFITGNTAVIAGHEDSDPDLNGEHVVTVIDATSFSVPVTTTVEGTGGTATVAWTELTVPLLVQAAILVMLTHLVEHRGDDMAADEQVWKAVERLLMRSRDPAYA